MVEFIDCASLSINYDVTGKVSMGMTVLKDSSAEIGYSSYTSSSFGSVAFTLIITSAFQKPIIGGSWFEWGLQLEGVAN